MLNYLFSSFLLFVYKHIIYSLREKKYFNLIKEKTVNPQVYYKYKFKTNAKKCPYIMQNYGFFKFVIVFIVYNVQFILKVKQI